MVVHSLCIIIPLQLWWLSIGAAYETAGIVDIEVLSFIFCVGAPIILLTFDLLPNYVYMPLCR